MTIEIKNDGGSLLTDIGRMPGDGGGAGNIVSNEFVREAVRFFLAEWYTALTIILANVICAFAFVYFTLPYKFPDLGVSGLAVLSNYIFGISPNWVIVGANMLLIAWGRRELSSRFLVLTLTSIFTMSIFLSLFETIPLDLPDDKFMATVISGLLKGAATGMMFRAGGSSGGLDIIAMVIRRRYGMEIGSFSIFVNFFILALSIGVVGLDSVVYGAVGLYVFGVTLDNVTRSFDRRKQAFIITNKPDEVSAFIASKNRGVTRLEGRGGYTGQERPVLMTLLQPRQVVQLKQFLRDEDPNAFVSICDAAEVIGQGFKSWKSL